jgi:hypothetical protein
MNILPDSFVSILAVMHYVKFFYFHISDEFIEEYESLRTAEPDSDESYMTAYSTIWFDIKIPNHRKQITSFLLALVAWADYQQDQLDSDQDMAD